MASYSKSTLDVARVAVHLGGQAVPGYWHRCSPKLYTRPQLLACLVVKCRLGLDYRGVATLLSEWAELREAVGLRLVPHFTTLQKNMKRLLGVELVRSLLGRSVRCLLGRRRSIGKAAIDSTGLSASHASAYFVRRRNRHTKLLQDLTYTRFGKLGVVCDCRTHLIVAASAGRGPRPDVGELVGLVDDALGRVRPTQLLADAGYDSEANHRHCREVHRLSTLIPPRHGRPSKDPRRLPRARWRRLMKGLLATRAGRRAHGYTQRWQVEAVFAMMKQHLGDRLRGRSQESQNAEMRLMVLTHNISLLRRFFEVLYRATVTPFVTVTCPVENPGTGAARSPGGG